MERNANDTFGSSNTGESTSGGYGTGTAGSANSPASFGAGAPAATSSSGTSDTSYSRDSSTDASGLVDRAKSAASTTTEKLADVGSTVRDRAGNLKNTLADALESGAEKLRAQSAASGQMAGAAATGGTSGMVGEGNRLGAATSQLAGGLQASADWLRDADLDGLKSGVERQVKEHPGRTLAVAVGLGYLLGKAFRK
jgi:ElaB/YqjD/DUF883 family membrane-anchored ribosome-binding protein